MKSLIGALVLIAGSYVVMAKAPMLRWESLYRSKKAAPTFDSEIRIAGYMIPIEAKPKFATEFILVPSIPACMHVPPPPVDQTIFVKMKKPLITPLTWDPILVQGTLKFKSENIKNYGAAAYQMEATKVELVKKDDLDEIRKILPKQTYVPDCNGRDKSDPICTLPGTSRKSSGQKGITD